MEKYTTNAQPMSTTSRDVLTDILRQGAQKMLAEAIENEVTEYLDLCARMRDDQGHRMVVRNGHLPSRTIQTGIGQVEVQQPRINDKRVDENGQRTRFSSKILPPYLRRTKSVDEAKYPKAVECLAKDRDVLLTFYDFPAEHWVHLRTTNPIESTFATVRLRTARTKGCGSRATCLTMVFNLAQCAERRWHRLHGKELLGEIIEGVKFVDGIKEVAA